MRMMRIVLVTCVVLMLCAAAAHAEKGGEGCNADREKFCRDVKAGKGAIARCMMEHNSELSAECTQELRERAKRLKEIKKACADDVGKFCKDVEHGKGKKRKCLKSHESELSDGCKTAMKK